jgi:hypothetical protein
VPSIPEGACSLLLLVVVLLLLRLLVLLVVMLLLLVLLLVVVVVVMLLLLLDRVEGLTSTSVNTSMASRDNSISAKKRPGHLQYSVISVSN